MYKKIYRSMNLVTFVSLFLATLLISAACYTYFDTNAKNELKEICTLTATAVNNSEDGISILKEIKNFRITLISNDGNVVYDSLGTAMDNHLDRPEVRDALEKGEGYSVRTSPTLGKKSIYHAVSLSDGTVLRLSRLKGKMPSAFYSILICVLFIMSLMYIFTAIASGILTENIIKPIRSINLSDSEALGSVYEEIRPFINRIANQNRQIDLQQEKVTAQKAHLRAIMDNINEGIAITDKNGEALSINGPALEILDADKRDLNGSLAKNTKISQIIAKALKSQSGSILYDKSNRTYQIFYSPIYEKKAVNGAVLMLFDVTERNESEKIRREFTANVSHELKTPLTTIHGYAQIIDSGIAKPDDIGGFIKKIEKESLRLMALVDDIIELSHLEEDKGSAPKEMVSLMSVAREVAEALSQKAEENAISVEVLGTDTTVHANLSQISELIYNLTDNAIKYNRPGGNVKIIIQKDEITVQDTGIGIPPEYRERVFERFFRVDKSHSKKVNGTGLGLSIVKHIAIANNATVRITDTPGGGSTFKVSFENAEYFI